MQLYISNVGLRPKAITNDFISIWKKLPGAIEERQFKSKSRFIYRNFQFAKI